MIGLVLNDAAGPTVSWNSGDNFVDSTMTSAEACQKWCSLYDACDFFSYEWEPADDGVYYHECFMKSMYSAEDGGADCHDYVLWGFSDADWDKKVSGSVVSYGVNGFVGFKEADKEEEKATKQAKKEREQAMQVALRQVQDTPEWRARRRWRAGRC